MKQIAFALAITIGIYGCGGPIPFSWPDLAQCAPDAPTIIDKVSSILFAHTHEDGVDSQAKDALLDLAKGEGADAVVCSVQRLRDNWTRPGATQTPERQSATEFADAWLLEIGTEVRTAGGEAP